MSMAFRQSDDDPSTLSDAASHALSHIYAYFAEHGSWPPTRKVRLATRRSADWRSLTQELGYLIGVEYSAGSDGVTKLNIAGARHVPAARVDLDNLARAVAYCADLYVSSDADPVISCQMFQAALHLTELEARRLDRLFQQANVWRQGSIGVAPNWSSFTISDDVLRFEGVKNFDEFWDRQRAERQAGIVRSDAFEAWDSTDGKSALAGSAELVEQEPLVKATVAPRRYYSARNTSDFAYPILDLSGLRHIVAVLYAELCDRGMLQEYLGFDCGDRFIPGAAGRDVGAYVFRKIKRHGLWPVSERASQFSEADAFDMIEFLFDHVSLGQPQSSHADRCIHYSQFNREAGQDWFRGEINHVLADYSTGYELAITGEIVRRSPEELRSLLERAVDDPGGEIESRYKAAVEKFQHRAASDGDRREAVRGLADILEALRPQLGKVLTRKDEADLFQIANRFGIRHHNERQHTDYDKDVWYETLFYYYAAMIRASTELLRRHGDVAPPSP